jgi:hypothetical protein
MYRSNEKNSLGEPNRLRTQATPKRHEPVKIINSRLTSAKRPEAAKNITNR